MYQGVEGCQFSGTSLALVENEGVWGFVGSKDSLCCGVVVDPVMAMVTCTEEENRGSAMLDIHPLVVLGEKGGSYLVSLDWVVERVIFFM